MSRQNQEARKKAGLKVKKLAGEPKKNLSSYMLFCAAQREAPLAATRSLRAALHRVGASPLQGAVIFPLILPPIILSFFAAVHDLCLAEPAMAREGALWFTDLVTPDTSSLLPIASNLTWLAQVEVGAGHLAGKDSVQDYLAKTGIKTARVKY